MDTGNKPHKKLDTVSLFSGCGGLDLGFLISGHFNIKFASDINPAAADTYSENFKSKKVSKLPKIPEKEPLFMISDIQDLDFAKLVSLFPYTEAVIGGPPCQDFSLARGTDREDTCIYTNRGKLYSYFVKALIYIKPKYFVFENVPGIISHNKGNTWDTIREDFTNLSLHAEDIEKVAGDGFSEISSEYFLAYQGVADASAVGVPQKRKRVIIVGVRKDLLKDSPVGSEDDLSNKIRQICTSKIQGEGLSFKEYPLSSFEAFEGNTLDQLEDKYRNIMKEWFFNDKNGEANELLDWVTKNSPTFKENILKNYCRANSSEFSYENLALAMEDHRKVLEYMRSKNVIESSSEDGFDESCVIPNEKLQVRSRLYFTPPDENYKFLYRHERWRVEGKNISMIYRRIHPLKPSYTVTASGGGGTHGYHYERSRSRLTNRERARLQSFPDWFKFIGTYTQQREIIGNAVPPILGKAVADAIFNIDRLLSGRFDATNQEHLIFKKPLI